MSKRHEDFDENSDPENPVFLKYEQIVEAAYRIKSDVTYTLCHPSHFSKILCMKLFYKMESHQPTGSIKERGALNALLMLPADKKKNGVVVASIGNHAEAMCYHAQRLNIPIMVLMPPSVPISKIQRCAAYGAKTVIHGNDIFETRQHARIIARDKGLAYIDGRDHPNVLAGHGSVALEILEQVPDVEAVIVPCGTGGLLAAVAVVMNHLKPDCLVYGVEPEVVPVLTKSLLSGNRETVPPQNTIADAIGITGVGVNSFYTLKPLVNKVLLIKEDWIARAILHLCEIERFVVEGAGACPLGAILGNIVPELKNKTVVCICTGGNIDTVLLGRCLDRGRAAEGRLVKFRVGIRDGPTHLEKMLRLLAVNGYSVVRWFRDVVWVEDDIHHTEEPSQDIRDGTDDKEQEQDSEDEEIPNQSADPLSDPKNPRKLQFEDVLEAAAKIKQDIPVTPCIPSNHQEEFVVKVYYKLENLHPTGSFKERGVLFTILRLIDKLNVVPKAKPKPKSPLKPKSPQKKNQSSPPIQSPPTPRPPLKMPTGLVVASYGNQALALCHHALKFKIRVVVVMPTDVPIIRVQRCKDMNAEVIIWGDTIVRADQYARAFAHQNKLTYINGRDHPDSLAGDGTVALEILDQVPLVDAVLVPAGSGGLLAAVAAVIKHLKPNCLVYGVGPEVMPALIKSLSAGKPCKVTQEATMADAIAMPVVGVNSFCTLKPLVDKMIPVTEVSIARAILHLYETERLVVEGAGACPLATIYDCLVPELITKTVVCIVSGGNIDTLVLSRCLDIGRAASDRLVKFKVKIIDTPVELMRLLHVLNKGGFFLYQHFRHRQWVEDDQQLVEMGLVVETKGSEHTEDLKTYIHAAYPGRAAFENESPEKAINCPCYVKKKLNYFS